MKLPFKIYNGHFLISAFLCAFWEFFFCYESARVLLDIYFRKMMYFLYLQTLKWLWRNSNNAEVFAFAKISLPLTNKIGKKAKNWQKISKYLYLLLIYIRLWSTYNIILEKNVWKLSLGLDIQRYVFITAPGKSDSYKCFVSSIILFKLRCL